MTMRRWILAGLLASGAFLRPAGGSAQIAAAGRPSGEVSGRVVTEEGVSLGNVLVYLVGTSHADTTALDGSFRLTGVRPGRYRVAAYHEQLGDDPAAVQPVEVTGGARATTLLRVRFPAVVAVGCPLGSGGVIHGQVRDASTGAPLVGAEVELRTGEGGRSGSNARLPAEPRRVRVGPAGEYRFCGVPVGTHQLTSGLSWTNRLDVEVVVPAERVVGVDLALSPVEPRPGRVVGRVVDVETGRPLEGATVEVGAASVVSDEDGRFRATDVKPGTVPVRSEVLGYAAAEGSVELEPGATQDVEIQLQTQPIEVDAVTVTTRPTGLRAGRLADLYERMESGWGTFVRGEELARRNIRKLTWILQEMGFRVDHNDRFLLNRRQRCAPMVYIDGIRTTYLPAPRGSMDAQEEAAEAVNFVNPASVAIMEVYQGPAELPAVYRGSGTRCGVIGIWTQGYGGSLERAGRLPPD